jgi:hypothetical protein
MKRTVQVNVKMTQDDFNLLRKAAEQRWPEIKKSPKRKAHHRLHRRKRVERAAAPETYLGAQGADACAAISLPREEAFRRGGHHLLEFLFSTVCRGDPPSAGDRVSRASAREGADRVGRTSRSPQPRGVEFRAATARAHVAGVSARLRARAEPDRIYLGSFEATRTAPFLPEGPERVERASRPRSEADATPSPFGYGLLAASGTFPAVTIL